MRLLTCLRDFDRCRQQGALLMASSGQVRDLLPWVVWVSRLALDAPGHNVVLALSIAVPAVSSQHVVDWRLQAAAQSISPLPLSPMFLHYRVFLPSLPCDGRSVAQSWHVIPRQLVFGPPNASTILMNQRPSHCFSSIVPLAFAPHPHILGSSY